MAANWLDIKPIKLGDNNSFLILTVLTRIAPAAKFLGLASTYPFNLNPAAKFDFSSFNKGSDLVNLHLTNQLYSEGITLKKFNENLAKFLKAPVKNYAQ